MEAFLTSTWLVALAEMGDRTQFLALILAARFKQPMSIIAGIFCATLANHFLSGLLGFFGGSLMSPDVKRWTVGLLFIGFAVWTIIPDKESPLSRATEFGAFAATLFSFFLVELGDKTQIATVTLAARFHAVVPVVIGTTFGLLAANIPIVFFGHKLTDRLPLRTIRAIAAVFFLVAGLLTILS